MEILVTQADLKTYDELNEKSAALAKKMAAFRATPEYIALETEGKQLVEQGAVLQTKFVEAAVKAKTLGVKVEPVGEKSNRPDLGPVTEPGIYVLKVTFGSKDNTAWKPVVEAIKVKNCYYKNGDGKDHPLNMVLPSMIQGQTTTSENTPKVEVKIKE